MNRYLYFYIGSGTEKARTAHEEIKIRKMSTRILFEAKCRWPGFVGSSQPITGRCPSTVFVDELSSWIFTVYIVQNQILFSRNLE